GELRQLVDRDALARRGGELGARADDRVSPVRPPTAFCNMAPPGRSPPQRSQNSGLVALRPWAKQRAGRVRQTPPMARARTGPPRHRYAGSGAGVPAIICERRSATTALATDPLLLAGRRGFGRPTANLALRAKILGPYARCGRRRSSSGGYK